MDFDRTFWERHWDGAHGSLPVNPHLLAQTAGLVPGTALDAGCGEGAEAAWLAQRGWRTTGADISATALARAAERAADVTWIEADLLDWEPEERFDLVTTFYAHPAIPQLEFYDRVARWVAPGGTLLVVGHGDGTAAEIAARLGGWSVVTAEESTREAGSHVLHDVVVRAVSP